MDLLPQDAPTPQRPPRSIKEPADLSRTAVLWAAALLGGVILSTWTASSDRANLSKLEQALENTAVGDKRFFAFESSQAPALLLGGLPLVAPSKSPEPLPEGKMRLSAYTDDASFRLYVPKERANGDAEAGGPSWYIKVGPGQFLRLTR